MRLTKEDIILNERTIVQALCHYHGLWTYSHYLELVSRCPSARLFARTQLYNSATDRWLLDEIVTFGKGDIEVSRAKAAARSATCKRITEALMRLCTPVTAVWRQVRIGCSYAWALVKARKTASCPYVTFRD